MKTSTYITRIPVLAGAAVLTLLGPPLLLGGSVTDSGSDAGFFSVAQAAQGKHQAGAGQGRAGADSGGIQGQRGGMDKILEVDDDSDRPAWAGGDKEENPHRGEGNPAPGDMKGDEYGDLWVYVRDETTGLPVTVSCDAGACYQVVVCADDGCTSTEVFLLSTDPEAELPAGVVPLEVDLGRLNLGRAPTKVLDHAEDEAISKITADGVTLTLDAAGRIVVDGATIDSPLENLALYIAIVTGDAEVLAALQPLLAETSTFELAASLLGGSADKTGEITPDVVFYSNIIYGLVPPGGGFVDYSAMEYDRTFYDTLVDYHYYADDGVTVLNATVNLKDYLDATQAAVPTVDGIVLFTVAADDALQVVDLIHTQIHDSPLPGTVEVPTS